MGDDMDFGYSPNSSYCEYAKTVRDCDGDLVTMCTDWGKCPYKRIVRDCDGDTVELCTK
jgi:hypothetical protein